MNDKAPRDPTVDAERAIAFLIEHFSDCPTGDILLWTLREGEKITNPEFRYRRHDNEVEAKRWLEHHGKTRNLYFSQGLIDDDAVLTKTGNVYRCAKNVRHLSHLYVDIDFAGLDLDVSNAQIEVLRRLYAATVPPTVVVRTGAGIHGYWKLRVPASGKKDLAQAERMIARLVSYCRADPGPRNRCSLLRLPFTRNFKYPSESVLVVKSGTTPTVALGDESFAIDEPLFTRRPKGPKKKAPAAAPPGDDGLNPFERFAQEFDQTPHVDVEHELATMVLGASDGTGVHATQVRCTSSLLSSGVPLEQVIAVVLDATMSRGFAKNWSRAKEEKLIREMSESWIPKKEELDRAAGKLDEGARGFSNGAADTESVDPKGKSSAGGGTAHTSAPSEDDEEDEGEEEDRFAPLPLYPELAPQRPYPLAALGVLAEGAAAIAAQAQAAPCIAGNAVLAVASLAVQALADAVMPIGRGRERPLSLYFVTVAQSGDRKTTCDETALLPVEQCEREMQAIYEGNIAAWRLEHRAWTAHTRAIDSKRGLSLDERKRLLKEAGPEPRRPLRPTLTLSDLTVQGLTRKWPTLPAALGLFSSEGGQMTGGYGFSPDQRLTTAAGLSRLWENGALRRLRASDEEMVDLHGRRLALHLMVQPEVALLFLGDKLLRNQGFLSRLLVGSPPSLAGSRLVEETEANPADEAALARYSALIIKAFDAWPDRLDEVKPRPLALNSEARALWAQFYNHVETEQGADGSLAGSQEIANKAGEQAVRIAGVLTLVANPQATSIEAEGMSNGVELAAWYLDEAVRLTTAAQVNEPLLRASTLLAWLHRSGRTDISSREAQQFGPYSLRQKAVIEAAFKVLIAHFWLRPHPKGKRRWLIVKATPS
jgi:hypothetical protein